MQSDYSVNKRSQKEIIVWWLLWQELFSELHLIEISNNPLSYGHLHITYDEIEAQIYILQHNNL